MAGKGYKPVEPEQTKQSIHFRLTNAMWDSLDSYCLNKRIKKQMLFEILTKAIVMNDYRIEEIVSEALDERKRRRGFDEIDIKQIQEMLYRNE